MKKSQKQQNNKQTVRDLAYKLYQVRSINGRHTSPEQDWYDAEILLNEEVSLSEKGQALLEELESDFPTLP